MKLSGGLLLLNVQENLCLQKTIACCYSKKLNNQIIILASPLKERYCKFAGLFLREHLLRLQKCCWYLHRFAATKCCICSIDCVVVSHARNSVTFGNTFSHLLATEILLTDSSLSFISTVLITLVKCYFHAASSGGDDSDRE